ncbi:hypothetical protein ARMGADRAFT_668436 [Armillaria gallica]|uniref:Transmembrane protein n=1 Tax=Armillaria gallica TaxID=47427 RepID=A0A2H3D8E8_ARMGA|nr:hypothetical protein ARMGADRAFT_668436 [Armillaria gallica]
MAVTAGEDVSRPCDCLCRLFGSFPHCLHGLSCLSLSPLVRPPPFSFLFFVSFLFLSGARRGLTQMCRPSHLTSFVDEEDFVVFVRGLSWLTRMCCCARLMSFVGGLSLQFTMRLWRVGVQGRA